MAGKTTGKRKAGAAANFVGFRATPELLSFLDARRRPGRPGEAWPKSV